MGIQGICIPVEGNSATGARGVVSQMDQSKVYKCFMPIDPSCIPQDCVHPRRDMSSLLGPVKIDACQMFFTTMSVT